MQFLLEHHRGSVRESCKVPSLVSERLPRQIGTRVARKRNEITALGSGPLC